MHGDQEGLRGRMRQKFSAFAVDGDAAAQEALRGRHAHGNNDTRADQLQFLLQPRMALLNIAAPRFLVNTSLTARELLEYKMLHRVGDIEVRALETGSVERPIQKTSRRPHKRFALPVFL